jgi:hypothetical protein
MIFERQSLTSDKWIYGGLNLLSLRHRRQRLLVMEEAAAAGDGRSSAESDGGR